MPQLGGVPENHIPVDCRRKEAIVGVRDPRERVNVEAAETVPPVAARVPQEALMLCLPDRRNVPVTPHVEKAAALDYCRAKQPIVPPAVRDEVLQDARATGAVSVDNQLSPN